jgi:hypothetical protein
MRTHNDTRCRQKNTGNIYLHHGGERNLNRRQHEPRTRGTKYELLRKPKGFVALKADSGTCTALTRSPVSSSSLAQKQGLVAAVLKHGVAMGLETDFKSGGDPAYLMTAKVTITDTWHREP